MPVANAAVWNDFLRFGADRNIGKSNKYADKHYQEFDLAHVFDSAVVFGKL